MGSTPGVVLVAGFVLPQNVVANYFENAQNYKDREEAKMNKIPNGSFEPESTLKQTYNSAFGDYHKYMGNEEKSTGLFDNYDDFLTIQKKGFYERKFASAYKQQGVMWIPIISFDNAWLKEQGIIGGAGNVDDELLKNATRKSINHLLKKESLLGNCYWTAAIHYNTDNIHIHVSVVEKVVKRQRGKMLQSSIDSSKAKIVSELTDRTSELIALNDLMRNQIIGSVRNMAFRDNFERKLKAVAKIEKRQYGRLSNLEKAAVDDLGKFILRNKFSKEYQDFNTKINEEMKFYQRAYGDGNRHLYKHYRENKENELISKLGNAILKHVELYRQEEFRNKIIKKRDKHELVSQKNKDNQKRLPRNRLPFYLRQIMSQLENETFKAIMAYENMVREVESENENF